MQREIVKHIFTIWQWSHIAEKVQKNRYNNNKIKYMNFYHNFFVEYFRERTNETCKHSLCEVNRSKFWTEPKYPNKKFHTEERKKKTTLQKMRENSQLFFYARTFVWIFYCLFNYGLFLCSILEYNFPLFI